jgi:cob(I)alamin adenosyltransferase
MVRIDRITTGGGDDGSTSLGDGTRVPKHDPRVEAYGTIDELSAVIGLAAADLAPEELAALLRRVQNDLFDVGSDLCAPIGPEHPSRLDASYPERLDRWIEEYSPRLEPLESFVLPGGSPLAARLHVARTVCRRAERRLCALLASTGEREQTSPVALLYLNRLSDLFFILARLANDAGREDVRWVPGGDGSR